MSFLGGGRGVWCCVFWWGRLNWRGAVGVVPVGFSGICLLGGWGGVMSPLFVSAWWGWSFVWGGCIGGGFRCGHRLLFLLLGLGEGRCCLVCGFGRVSGGVYYQCLVFGGGYSFFFGRETLVVGVGVWPFVYFGGAFQLGWGEVPPEGW